MNRQSLGNDASNESFRYGQEARGSRRLSPHAGQCAADDDSSDESSLRGLGQGIRRRVQESHSPAGGLPGYIVVQHLDDEGLLDAARLNSPLCERAGPGPAPHPLPKHATRRAPQQAPLPLPRRGIRRNRICRVTSQVLRFRYQVVQQRSSGWTTAPITWPSMQYVLAQRFSGRRSRCRYVGDDASDRSARCGQEGR